LQKIPKENIKRILILKWSALGDVIISSAIFEDVRNAFPNASLDLQTSNAYENLFANDPRFEKVLTVDPKGRDKGFSGLWRLLRQVRQESYDLVIDLQSNDRSRMFLSLLRLFSGGHISFVGLHDYFPYHAAPGKDAPAGFVRQQMALASAGIDAETKNPCLHIPKSHEDSVQKLLRQYGLQGSGYIVFLPGSNPDGKLKRWGAHRYASLADALHNKAMGPAVLVGGPDDKEECEAIVDQVENQQSVINLCCQTKILDIVPLVEKAGFVVGSDTGPAHVASAAGCPMLIICGPTDPKRVKPAGDHVEAIQADIDCKNCYKKECDHHSCMKAITVEMILERIEEGFRRESHT
jgi:heptosyltransferase-2